MSHSLEVVRADGVRDGITVSKRCRVIQRPQEPAVAARFHRVHELEGNERSSTRVHRVEFVGRVEAAHRDSQRVRGDTERLRGRRTCCHGRVGAGPGPACILTSSASYTPSLISTKTMGKELAAGVVGATLLGASSADSVDGRDGLVSWAEGEMLPTLSRRLAEREYERPSRPATASAPASTRTSTGVGGSKVTISRAAPGIDAGGGSASP